MRSHLGQVTVSLGSEKDFLFVVYQAGGPERDERIQLRATTDGDVYFYSNNQQMSPDHVAQHILSEFVLAIPM